MNQASTDAVELRGERVMLRDPRAEDTDARLRWLTVETEWGEWDAPWEGNEPLPEGRVSEVRRKMLGQLSEPLPAVRTMLYIQLIDGPLLGWVSWYDPDGSQPCVWVGIDICESDFWGRGIGTEALKLWIGYLFSNLEIDTIRMSTWSGNERMIRCGEKLGFVLEERIIGSRKVKDNIYDAVRFKLTRVSGKR